MKSAEPTSTKERLLDVARDLYLEVGPSRFSLREVARRCDLTAAAIYRHYEGKDALLGAVCAEGFRVFASYLMAALAQPHPDARLRMATDQYLRFALERPRDYRVIFMSEPVDRSSIGPPLGAAPDPSFQFLVDRVRECQTAKVIRRGDAREIAVTIWAHLHGLVSLRLAGLLGGEGADPKSFGALYAKSTSDLLAGLAP